ncbi:UDP-3-O-acylglucosamine N-acyltransferase [Thalassoglobus neptunius]|uniref:UDP-3-O-acylglucosamine N-acyltransferase n=1 Tax=Thalassoglobus neptunius TaxID=1938619 RepID=A0A5C5W7T0_9PLAN|nr:UDP-3-O-(3-hydroxymyristoyl)glucosamine N-acyltransferase [Thalassoglobus neptunius]TWT46958.1 UDP-3-O-acylglucosamine N-acyltransferase [Thalassoglobus neptunius]
MPITIDALAQHVSGEVLGNGEILISDVASLETAGSDNVSYLDSRKQLRHALNSAAGAMITTAKLSEEFQRRGSKCALILVDQPQQAFIEAMLHFRPQAPRTRCGISSNAQIDESAVVGEDCDIYPNAWIGKNVRLGDRCEIGPGAVIADNVTIGDDCVIHANAVIYHDVEIHDRVIVHANAVIGADGFGYRFVNGAFVRIPHTGSVIVQNDVEIGACTTIDRGMIHSTVIGEGTKLDNQVMIAHNCQIGKHNAFASQVGLAGSCTTGDYVQMGGQVGVADHVNIGPGTKFGGKSGVIWDMPAGGTFHGIPAINEKDCIRNHFSIQKLPELRDQVKQLSEQLAELKAQLADSSQSDQSSQRSAA